MTRLALNDSSVQMTLESSSALGQGFRVGFLGQWREPPAGVEAGGD
jgi:translation elongation factor EF-4